MTKRNRFKKSVLVQGATFSVVAGALSLGLSSVAKAVTVTPTTFAEFEQASSATNSNLFQYLETGIAGSGGSAQLTATSIPVNFSFESIATMPADLQGPQSATLTLTSSTATGMTIPFTGFGDEQFGTTNTLTITRNTGALEGNNLKTNLLTMTFTGQLFGVLNGFTSQLTGQTTNGNTVSYTSDFLNFPASPVADYQLGFTSWDSTGGGGLQQDTTSNFFKAATASGTGSFDVGPNVTVVPEPMTGTLVLTGLGMMFLRRRNRSV
jgi:hypothetical protein